MQTSFSIREALVATILLTPALINGLALPWNMKPDGLAARSVITGGVVDTNFHIVRSKESAGSGETESKSAEATDESSGGSSGTTSETGGSTGEHGSSSEGGSTEETGGSTGEHGSSTGETGEEAGKAAEQPTLPHPTGAPGGEHPYGEDGLSCGGQMPMPTGAGGEGPSTGHKRGARFFAEGAEGAGGEAPPMPTGAGGYGGGYGGGFGGGFGGAGGPCSGGPSSAMPTGMPKMPEMPEMPEMPSEETTGGAEGTESLEQVPSSSGGHK